METQGKEYILNFGPHHPSTHGVLRLILKMDGEKIISCKPDIGYLHRGIEKILESKGWISAIPFLDRLDYLAPLHTEHAYAMCIETSLRIRPSSRSLYIRTIFDELTRIASHVIAIGSMTHDIGMLSILLYSFEERDKILDIFEIVTGARMHPTYYIPGGVFNDIRDDAVQQIYDFINGINFYMEAVSEMALNNRIFKNRTCKVGVVSKNDAIAWGFSGPNARASGIAIDLRKTEPYGAYKNIKFNILAMNEGDCYARVHLRFKEIWQSVDIIRQCLLNIPKGSVLHEDIKLDHLSIAKNTTIYKAAEGPRGEVGIFLCTNNDTKTPHRLRVRSASFPIVQSLQHIMPKNDIQDATAILGSLDFIMGDCDR